MLSPCILLLAICLLVPAEDARAVAAQALPQWALRPGAVALPEPTGWTLAEPWLALAGTAGLAGFALFHEALPRALPRAVDRLSGPVLKGLNRLHTGIVSDYVVWIALGLAMLAGWASL